MIQTFDNSWLCSVHRLLTYNAFPSSSTLSAMWASHSCLKVQKNISTQVVKAPIYIVSYYQYNDVTSVRIVTSCHLRSTSYPFSFGLKRSSSKDTAVLNPIILYVWFNRLLNSSFLCPRYGSRIPLPKLGKNYVFMTVEFDSKASNDGNFSPTSNW